MSEGTATPVTPMREGLDAILAQQAYVARAIAVYEALLVIEAESGEGDDAACITHLDGDWNATGGGACGDAASLPGACLVLAAAIRAGGR